MYANVNPNMMSRQELEKYLKWLEQTRTVAGARPIASLTIGLQIDQPPRMRTLRAGERFPRGWHPDDEGRG